MRRFLDWLGSGFVYRSPTNKIEAWRKNAMYMSSRQLRDLTGYSAHYSKKSQRWKGRKGIGIGAIGRH